MVFVCGWKLLCCREELLTRALWQASIGFELEKSWKWMKSAANNHHHENLQNLWEVSYKVIKTQSCTQCLHYRFQWTQSLLCLKQIKSILNYNKVYLNLAFKMILILSQKILKLQYWTDAPGCFKSWSVFGNPGSSGWHCFTRRLCLNLLTGCGGVFSASALVCSHSLNASQVGCGFQDYIFSLYVNISWWRFWECPPAQSAVSASSSSN